MMAYNHFMKKTAALLVLLILLGGCGRIVTDKTITDSSGNAVDIREVEFTFTFAGTPAIDSNYKYYLIIATQNISDNGLRLLEAVDGALVYFASPDDTNISSQNFSELAQYYTYDSGADYNDVINTVYEQYFAKWAQYFVYGGAGQFLMRYGNGGGFSPVNQGQLTPQQAQLVSRVGNNQLRWNIPLSMLGDDFYFALLTVYDTAGSPRRLMDGIGLKLVGLNSANKITDEDRVLDRTDIITYPGLNIINYNVQIREY
ncbi:hypothetical protein NO1_0083 [Candidatus Termititenax aidoneus]|uniref:Uncharacterized protein n=1 Tax=Termititenax aidoneus TaxID=2218524 RepID=A0A388T7B6_TERA1|nr:hypothetical protein NO1_0083 [Candidatus Termititenax aidoneus]